MDSQIQNGWVERPYLARHVDQSDAQQFLQKYSSELKSRGRHIQQQVSRGNVEPFIEHANWLQNNLGLSPLITSAYDAAVQFNEKYNLPKAELASNRDYSQALYHDAFQHGIPERLVGVVDKTAPTMLTAADESRAVSLQMQQEHLKRNASPEIWYRYMQTITEPKNDFNLVGQEVAALSQKNPDTSTDKLRLAAVNRFPSLSRESLQGLRANLNDPYLADLSVSEKLSQAGRLKAGLESFAAKVRQNPEGGVSPEIKKVANAAFKKLAFY